MFPLFRLYWLYKSVFLSCPSAKGLSEGVKWIMQAQNPTRNLDPILFLFLPYLLRCQNIAEKSSFYLTQRWFQWTSWLSFFRLYFGDSLRQTRVFSKCQWQVLRKIMHSKIRCMQSSYITRISKKNVIIRIIDETNNSTTLHRYPHPSFSWPCDPF